MDYNSCDESATFELGRSIGQQAKPGEIYCLSGELGAGKTVFAKGFASGLGVREIVTSPTFTIVNEYGCVGVMPQKLFHFDVYRIVDADEMFDIGYEEMFFGDGVCLVEWAEQIAELIPAHAEWIYIEKQDEMDCRKIRRDKAL